MKPKRTMNEAAPCEDFPDTTEGGGGDGERSPAGIPRFLPNAATVGKARKSKMQSQLLPPAESEEDGTPSAVILLCIEPFRKRSESTEPEWVLRVR